MKKSINTLFQLMNSAIHKDGAPSIPEGMDIQSIYKDILQFDLFDIVHPVIYEYFHEDVQSMEIIKLWNKSMKHIYIQQFIASQQTGMIVRLLEEHNIKPIVIKGLSIARYYKDSFSRHMCDLDLLVDQSQFDEAKKILIQFGYECSEEENNPLHTTFVKKNFIIVELHKGLVHSGYLGHCDTEKWYEHIWTNKQRFDISSVSFYGMCAEDEIINQVVHFISHFVFYGSKIRNIYEIALIIQSSVIDWRYVSDILTTLGFYEFACLLFSLCKTYFAVQIPEYISQTDIKVQEHFLDDLFSYYFIEKKEGNLDCWLNILNNYRFILKRRLMNPLISLIVISSMIKLRVININSFLLNTKMLIRKSYVIRKYNLIKSSQKRK